ncbi:MAG: SLBB domain-containing protein [Butyrivibrio sp.]|nr:SLBB domain-containing protein [Butyrivibrio sp.]
MKLDALKEMMREAGVVGAGGAGFPAYAKLDPAAGIDTLLLNCVECEPLLKLHRQLLAAHAQEIIGMLDEVRDIIGAREAVIGIKDEYRETIDALREVLRERPAVRLALLRPAYPMGDEVILIYEATGRVVRPGGLPAQEHCVVFNVETMYNLYRAVHERAPVTDKVVSIVGEVRTPVTLRLPIGMSVSEAVGHAGGTTAREPVYLMGGPMMGRLGSGSTVITRTTNAIIVLEAAHPLIRRMNRNLAIERRRASSSCCQCRTCTDLCSRHALGHPIEPHRIMRAVAQSDTSDLSVFVNSAFCSGCGICEQYACPQGLSPKSIIQEFKAGLRSAGVKAGSPDPAPVSAGRDYRQVPTHRLAARLGLAQYDTPAPLSEIIPTVSRVRIPLSQHIGAPAVPVVQQGDRVERGQMIAAPADGLSVGIHASVTGVVREIAKDGIVIG